MTARKQNKKTVLRVNFDIEIVNKILIIYGKLIKNAKKNTLTYVYKVGKVSLKGVIEKD